MSTEDHIYKTVELTGTSRSTLEAAVTNAIRTASKTLRSLRWFEVVDVRGDIENDSDIRWQVTLKVGFTVESAENQEDERSLHVFGKRRVRVSSGSSKTRRRKA